MPKMTLLEMTQDILNDLDGDEVTSIDDTMEATQIANIIRTTFHLMMDNKDWPHTKGIIQFVASGTTDRPTHMTMATNVKKIMQVYYDKRLTGETQFKFLEIKFMNSDDFLRMTNSRNNDESNIQVVTDTSGITYLIRNDLAPQWYTSFDDETIIFDSFDNVVDSTLQASKVQCIGYSVPSFTLLDAFVPDLPIEAFGYLLEESKSKCSLKLRQSQDIKAELESRKQGAWLSRNAFTIAGGILYDNYGRHRSRTRKTSRETNGV